ncbi:MAG TPA: DUF2917 domain-containing protein [Burkholderiales bacterium]|nr:DUF2917 domain-containing protein [Burkholderiales bacterium]
MKNEYVVHGSIAMTRGSLMRLEDGRGMRVHVWEGAVWITQEGDRRDYFVPARTSFRITGARLTLISAIARSSIALTSPYEEDLPGKLSALRARLAKTWAGWFAPHARATSASP